MEQIVNVVMNNGLGFASFVALIFFIYKYMDNMNETVEEISKTLSMIQTSLTSLENRIENIENKINR